MLELAVSTDTSHVTEKVMQIMFFDLFLTKMGWYIETKAKDNDKRTYKKQAKYNELFKLNLCISKMNLFYVKYGFWI